MALHGVKVASFTGQIKFSAGRWRVSRWGSCVMVKKNETGPRAKPFGEMHSVGVRSMLTSGFAVHNESTDQFCWECAHAVEPRSIFCACRWHNSGARGSRKPQASESLSTVGVARQWGAERTS